MTIEVPLQERLGLGLSVQATETARLFRLAEEKIKLVEKLSNELVIPAINELRYAGYHLVEYLTLIADPDAPRDLHSEELRKAQNHCKRAIYDAVEAGTTMVLESIKAFQNDFRMVVLSEHIEDYAAIRARIHAATELVLRSKGENEDRGDYYEQCTEHLKLMREDLHTLELSRDELVKVLRISNQNTIWARAAVILAGLALLVSLMAYIAPRSPEPAAPVASVAKVGAVAPTSTPSAPPAPSEVPAK